MTRSPACPRTPFFARLLLVALALVGAVALVSAGPRAGVNAQEAPADLAEVAVLAAIENAEVGEAAMVAVDGLSYRDAPGLDTGVLTLLAYGTEGLLTDGPVMVDGYTWWEFTLAGSVGTGAMPGWVAGEFLVPVTGAATGYAVGDIVFAGGPDLHMRDAPSLAGLIIAGISTDQVLTIIDGPVVADGYTWYRVSIGGIGTVGWVAGEFLVPTSTSPGTGTGTGFAFGDVVLVTADGLNLRAAPGVGGAVVVQLLAGTTALIIGDPVAADGYTWYQVVINGSGDTGWAAGEFLTYP